jgi:ribose transport system ATP-binding protein
MNKQPVIEVKNICKSFTSTKALQNVSLQLYPGEITGLIGENGSGKSTLAAIISGNLKADEGEMFLFGQPYMPSNSFDASEKGISMIVQEQGTIGSVTVAANIFAGREKIFCKYGFLNRKKLNNQAQILLQNIGVDDIDARSITEALSFEDRKMVEIARAFYKTPELFIVDETTTALPLKGRNILYGLIKDLKQKGKSVLFISHDIDELIRVCDNIIILRDGIHVADLNKEEMVPARMKSLMVGREVMDNYYRSDYDPSPKSDKTVLKVSNISSGILKDISFELKEGEILGFAGLSDCGMHDLGKVIFGLNKPSIGKVEDGDGVLISYPQKAIRRKIGFMSKNRDTESMLITLSIKENIVLPSLHNLKKFGFFITPKSETRLADKWCKYLNVKMRELRQACSELSGGNKQKIVLAKWLGNDSNILILDCPTRGIDIGVKEAIYKIMIELKKQGKSIIMISEELPELIGMSDRIIVMKDGTVTKTFVRNKELTEAEVIQYMI